MSNKKLLCLKKSALFGYKNAFGFKLEIYYLLVTKCSLLCQLQAGVISLYTGQILINAICQLYRPVTADAHPLIVRL